MFAEASPHVENVSCSVGVALVSAARCCLHWRVFLCLNLSIENSEIQRRTKSQETVHADCMWNTLQIQMFLLYLFQPDRTYNLIIHNPPTSWFLLKAAGIKKGASDPGKEPFGYTTSSKKAPRGTSRTRPCTFLAELWRLKSSVFTTAMLLLVKI